MKDKSGNDKELLWGLIFWIACGEYFEISISPPCRGGSSILKDIPDIFILLFTSIKIISGFKLLCTT